MAPVAGGPGGAAWFDKVAPKFAGWDDARFRAGGFRAVPGCVVRRSAYIAPGVVLMPCFINVGARVERNSMIDTWATVASKGPNVLRNVPGERKWWYEALPGTETERAKAANAAGSRGASPTDPETGADATAGITCEIPAGRTSCGCTIAGLSATLAADVCSRPPTAGASTIDRITAPDTARRRATPEPEQDSE